MDRGRVIQGLFVTPNRPAGRAVAQALPTPLRLPVARQMLPLPVVQKMEEAFGARFSDVRVHVGPEAASIGARAFTTGSSIYFARGEYDPNSPAGQRVLAHELAHVVQQRSGRVRPLTGKDTIVRDPACEAEADSMCRVAVQRLQAPIQMKKPKSQRNAEKNLRRATNVAHAGAMRKLANERAQGNQVGQQTQMIATAVRGSKRVSAISGQDDPRTSAQLAPDQDASFPWHNAGDADAYSCAEPRLWVKIKDRGEDPSLYAVSVKDNRQGNAAPCARCTTWVWGAFKSFNGGTAPTRAYVTRRQPYRS